MAGRVARHAEAGHTLARRLIERGDLTAVTAAAELLWHVAQAGKLDDPLCEAAASLLSHADPFVRALAEWAIAIRVGLDNGGQTVRWPRANAPDWFREWTSLEPAELLELDYARQGLVWKIHRHGSQLLGSVDKIIRRAEGAASLHEAGSPGATQASEHIGRLKAIRGQLSRALSQAPGDLALPRKLWTEARRTARRVVMLTPCLRFPELLCVLRHSAHSHRNITGSQYPWVYKPGGGIVAKNGLQIDSPLRDVTAGQLGPGHVHGMDLWWDADRIVFAFARQPNWPPALDTVRGNCAYELRKTQEPTHLYEIAVDGSRLRQVTNHRTWSDFEPTYCADGSIVFASDRSGRSSECGRFSADHTVINLYRVAPDGTALRRLTDNKDIDRHPHSLDDGRIAYTRWEYQERHFLEVHAVWSVRPDGTMADAVFNQHMRAPYGLRDTRSVPGCGRLIAIATGHHTFAYGPVVLLNAGSGINEPELISIVTPHVRPQEGGMAGTRVPSGGVPDGGGLYQTPYALSDTTFLVSYSYGRPPSNSTGGRNETNFAIYVIDVFGNKELIHRDLIYSAAFPMPRAPRPCPPVLPDAVDVAQATAQCLVGDVYHGLDGVAQGHIRAIRVLQRVGWPLDREKGAMRWIPGNAWERRFGYWSWAPVRVLGTVPVEADGSACFTVPADTAVYFQLLDENGMEVRRMRSHISFQPGEERGCIGCHESQPKTLPVSGRAPAALAAGPAELRPPSWGGERLLGYEWLVQPILDRNCVRCHGAASPKAGLDFTATRTESGFMRSFCTMFGSKDGKKKTGKALVSVSNRFGNASVSKPRQFGSHKSLLITTLLNDPKHRQRVTLSPEEWEALVTWVDANAPYHDAFFNKRPASGAEPQRTVSLSP